MKKLLLSILGGSAALAALFVVTGCGTEPKGTEGVITLSDSLYAVGTKSPVTVTLKDADLTNTADTVKVISGADAVGTKLILTGKNGVYTGQLAFSTVASGLDTIMVINNTLITITYKDAKPAADRTATLFWKGGALGVALNNTTYQGVVNAMTITVTDTNVSSATVSANVSTTTFATPVPVVLHLSGVAGVYAGSVYFTVGTTITGADTVHVHNNDTVTVTYSDAVVPGSVATQKAQWTAAQPITVAPGAATYTGLTNKITINVNDPNVTTSTVTVHLASQKDPTGIDLVLPFANGGYSIQVGVSLTASVPGSVIAIQAPSDNMTITYSDPAISTAITGTVMWQAASVSIATDSSTYNGFENMMISLTDDHTTAATLVVNVSSQNAGDTIPVTLTALQATPWIFTGTVGFSLGVKTASAVGVQDSDKVTVSYFDSAMSQLAQSVPVNWYSTQKPAFGIFSPNYVAASSINPNVILQLIPWTGAGGGVTIDATDSVGENGGYAVAVTSTGATWGGFGWADVTVAGSGTLAGLDMTTYAACTLHVSMKCATPGADFGLLVENLAHAGQTWITASSAGFMADGNWHDLAIPLSAWAPTCDLTNVDYFLGVNMLPYTVGETVVIDNVYWTLPATPVAKKSVLAKVKAK